MSTYFCINIVACAVIFVKTCTLLQKSRVSLLVYCTLHIPLALRVVGRALDPVARDLHVIGEGVVSFAAQELRICVYTRMRKTVCFFSSRKLCSCAPRFGVPPAARGDLLDRARVRKRSAANSSKALFISCDVSTTRLIQRSISYNSAATASFNYYTVARQDLVHTAIYIASGSYIHYTDHLQ